MGDVVDGLREWIGRPDVTVNVTAITDSQRAGHEQARVARPDT